MTHRFSEVPSIDMPRSVFDRSCGYKTTFDAGYLVPVYCDFMYPGDSAAVELTGFARLSTPTSPIMDNMRLDTFFFSVPIRQLWTNWKKFCGEQVDPGDSISYSIPQIEINNIANETLYDYFGLPTQVGAAYNVNNLMGRAYNHIYNEWFRDQNLQDSVTVDTDDGPDSIADYVLLKRGKRHDYFTSALPFLQKGDAVELSLGDYAPIYGHNLDFDAGDDSANRPQVFSAKGGSTLRNFRADSSILYGNNNTSGTGELRTDLENATASTVNELRQAVQVQRLLERDARAGTRYAEIVKSHFGVDFPDLAYRPEYLGGGSSPVAVAPVARTDSSPGDLGAVGTVGFRGHGFVKSFTEHCVVIGVAVVTADLTYQEGIERHWLDQTRYDLYWPSLAHLGEQIIENQEIYIDAAMIGAGTEDDVFGYQERYAHLRYKPSKITGKFRSNDANTLDVWHLGIEFGSLPTLDASFIVEDPPVDRVIVTPTEPHFIFDSWLSYKHTRALPVYSVPGFIDHF